MVAFAIYYGNVDVGKIDRPTSSGFGVKSEPPVNVKVPFDTEKMFANCE